MTNPDDPQWWEANGYIAGKEMGAGLWICLARMLFTWRLMICDPNGVFDFYCYPDLPAAIAAFEAWDGTGDPLDGWVKHFGSGRRVEPTKYTPVNEELPQENA